MTAEPVAGRLQRRWWPSAVAPPALALSCTAAWPPLNPLAQVTAALSQLDRVSILAEALPYMQKFAGKTIVVKYGGAAMKDPTLKVGTHKAAET